MSRLSPHLRGIIYAIMGFTLWVVVDALMKLAAEAELPPYEIVGVMGGIAALILAIRAQTKNSIASLWPQNGRGQCLLAAVSIIINYANVVALKHLPLTLFYILAFTAPMMMAILAKLFLKEPLGWIKFLAIVTGFGGVVIAVNPQHISGGDATGYIAEMIAASFFAVYIVLSRFLTRKEAPESLVFFNGAVQGLLGLTLTFFQGGGALTTYAILILLAMGCLNLLGNLLTFASVKYAPAGTVAPYHYTQLIAGALIAFLIWHEWPTTHLIAGAAIIIASGIYIATHGGKTEGEAIAVEATGTRE